MPAKGRQVIQVGLLRRSTRNAKYNPTGASKISGDQLDERNHCSIVKKEQDEKSFDIADKSKVNYDTIENVPDGYLLVDDHELDLERTLLGGQSFRWTKGTIPKLNDIVFTGVIGQHALQLWRCDKFKIAFKKLNIEGSQKENDLKLILEDYFQLQYELKNLYEHWSAKDENLKKCCSNYKGFRILRQDPVENVFSFICATCNNIKRISQMVDKMCSRFGDTLESKEGIKLANLETGSTSNPFSTFPSVERLAQDDVFECLRHELGFGYRAKFIFETAKQVIKLAETNNCSSPREYLLSLRNMPYKETCLHLQQFPGIGRKVADCICLMSMDHLSAIPVDCHIYEIFCRNYMPNLRKERKSLTETVHDLIGTYFTELHGPLAGWSTSVLFIAELKHLRAPKTVEQPLEKNWSKSSNKTARSKTEADQLNVNETKKFRS